MGLATINIDSHRQKAHTEINKILKFGVNRVLTEIQRFKNFKINKEMYGHPDAVFGQRSDGHTFLCKFWHFKWLYLAYHCAYLYQIWGFCKAWSALYDYVDH